MIIGEDVIPISLARPDTSTLSDRVVAELQQRILSGELAVGSRLPTETELCEMLAVSRSVIRDALRTLRAMGLVSVEHGRGISVTYPNDRSVGAAMAILLLRSGLTIGDLIDARRIVETELCTLAARYATDDDIACLAERFEAFRNAVERGDTEQIFDEHLRFHAALYGAIRVPAMSLLLCPMVEVIMLSSIPPGLDDRRFWDPEAHERILEALRARDEQRLKLALQDHFQELGGPDYEQYRATKLYDSDAVRKLIQRINESAARTRDARDERGSP